MRGIASRFHPDFIGTRDGPSLRVAAGPGRLLCCGSSTMLSFASTASPRLASTPVASATRLAGLLG
jgi:hypothetical protein